jgi:atypical dual specificity phosphatase
VVFSFTWIVADQLGACSAPQSQDDLRRLHAEKISLVVNLLENGHPEEALAGFAMRELHLPVRDFTAPTLDQIEAAVTAIDAAHGAGERVVVHCAAGIGRTGTLVACYLVSAGMSPDAAITRVRELRPGSLEVDEQVDAVSMYEAHLRGASQGGGTLTRRGQT